jgi:riboflavin kinase / FMN adenylyltransferase
MVGAGVNVWNELDAFPTGREPLVATIGNFDGVHLGHRAILASVTAAAKARSARSLLITFDPHPLAVVAPSRRPRLLQTRRQKLETLEDARIDGVLILPFDRELASLDGESFFGEFLAQRLQFASVHVGRNFRFGRARGGDLRVLEAIGRDRGFSVVGVPPVEIAGETVSSSAIRAAIEEGDVERARAMLGRPFAVTGEVIRGDGRGRTLEFPTANLAVENETIPRRGVYVTETVAFASRFPSVTNVGVRPTFGGTTLSVETHLLDVDEDLYGERLEVRFLARLRDERTFRGAAELADQIARDRAAASSYFTGLTLTRG